MRARALGLIAIVASIALVSHPSAQPSRAGDTPRPMILVVDEGPAPSSLMALANKADAIVRARITAVGGTSEALAGATTPLAVHYDSLAVLETLKAPASGPARPGSEMRLMQFGGTIESLGRQVKTFNDSAIAFQKDREFVLFVRKHPLTDAFVLVVSPVSAFEVAAGGRMVAVSAPARALPELAYRTSLSIDMFRAIVRDAR